MTDEEKKAVDKINELVEYLRKWNENVTIVPADIKYFEKILDMIKTYIRMIDENIEEILEQSKEIEELKKYKEGYKLLSYSLDNYTSNDKIKAKIEEKFLEAKGLYERGVQPQAQYTMKLLRDLENSLLEKE